MKVLEHDYTASERIDIGHGVSIEKRYVDGVLGGVAYWHQTPAGEPCEGYVAVKPSPFEAWDLVSLEPLTLSPSLLCLACNHHGFIRDGAWVPA